MGKININDYINEDGSYRNDKFEPIKKKKPQSWNERQDRKRDKNFKKQRHNRDFN